MAKLGSSWTVVENNHQIAYNDSYVHNDNSIK